MSDASPYKRLAGKELTQFLRDVEDRFPDLGFENIAQSMIVAYLYAIRKVAIEKGFNESSIDAAISAEFATICSSILLSYQATIAANLDQSEVN